MFTKSSHSITMSDIDFLEYSIEQGLPNDFISHYLKKMVESLIKHISMLKRTMVMLK